jgi:hypothetical protein
MPLSFAIVSEIAAKLGRDIANALNAATDSAGLPPNLVRTLHVSGAPLTAPVSSAEEVLFTLPIPGGLMGLNGCLRVWASWSLPAGTVTTRVRFSGAGGVAFGEYTYTGMSTQSTQELTAVQNRGVTNAQVSASSIGNPALGPFNDPLATASVDTESDTELVISAEKNTASDVLVLERFHVELLRPPET